MKMMLYKFISFAAIIAVILSGCSVPLEDSETETSSETTGTTISSSITSATEQANPPQDEEAIEEEEYILPDLSYVANTEMFENIDEEKGTYITIEYPQLTEMEDEEKQRKINCIIKDSALEPYYYLELERDNEFDNTSWPVEYKIVYASEDILSVRFEGHIYIKGGAHGTNWKYTTNINLNTGERIILEELFNDSLYSNCSDRFRYIYDWQKNEEGSIAHEIYKTSPEIIAKIFQQHEDYHDTGIDDFYFTENEFALIISSGHAMGDNLDFLASYDSLRDVRNMDNPIWDRILVAE